MNITIDTDSKIIKVQDGQILSELIEFLESSILDWKSYKLRFDTMYFNPVPQPIYAPIINPYLNPDPCPPWEITCTPIDSNFPTTVNLGKIICTPIDPNYPNSLNLSDL